jgi:hypothetical protein
LPFEYQALHASEVNPSLFYGGKTNEYSFFNTQGKPVSGETYSQITPLNNGFFSVKKDKNNYAVVNPDGKRISEFLFSSMLPAERPKSTVKAIQESKFVCLDADGKVISCE